MPDGARLVDNGRELRSGEGQPLDRFLSEFPRLDRLNDEHAEQHAGMEQGDAEKGPVRIFAGFAEVLEPGVQHRVGDSRGLLALGDEAGEPLAEAHAYPADALRAEADRGGEHQVRAVRFEQVDRADVGVEAPLDFVNDVGERLRRISLRRYQPADLIEVPGHRRFETPDGGFSNAHAHLRKR